MKNMTLAAALLVTLMGSAQAGLLDAVTDTATALNTATDGGASTDKAVLELVKTKVQEGATKEQVKAIHDYALKHLTAPDFWANYTKMRADLLRALNK